MSRVSPSFILAIIARHLLATTMKTIINIYRVLYNLHTICIYMRSVKQYEKPPEKFSRFPSFRISQHAMKWTPRVRLSAESKYKRMWGKEWSVWAQYELHGRETWNHSTGWPPVTSRMEYGRQFSSPCPPHADPEETVTHPGLGRHSEVWLMYPISWKLERDGLWAESGPWIYLVWPTVL